VVADGGGIDAGDAASGGGAAAPAPIAGIVDTAGAAEQDEVEHMVVHPRSPAYSRVPDGRKGDPS
jgi:hypothetical protein